MIVVFKRLTLTLFYFSNVFYERLLNIAVYIVHGTYSSTQYSFRIFMSFLKGFIVLMLSHFTWFSNLNCLEFSLILMPYINYKAIVFNFALQTFFDLRFYTI